MNQVSFKAFIASLKMSKKIHIVVEGPDDKVHLNQLLHKRKLNHKTLIKSAHDFHGQGDAKKNNRLKIEMLHEHCRQSADFKNVLYLCDREYSFFVFEDLIQDVLEDQGIDGKYYTSGHSLENYFFSPHTLITGFRYHTDSIFKNEAEYLFRQHYLNFLVSFSSLCLAAKDIKLPFRKIESLVHWTTICLEKGGIDPNRMDQDLVKKAFQNLECNFNDWLGKSYYYQELLKSSSDEIYWKVCRGHTGIRLLQRAFSACIYHCGFNLDRKSAEADAERFYSIQEKIISASLCEAWIQDIDREAVPYPYKLLEACT
ncbi:hypothetical protein W04_3545 [Pseudoalteromonas sp. SW0106-04]|uniref:DUF4435 domain-containing protein n=1 Tax=Pseudoalteromonas sp. SW0106-04 TaxID=1702169 RepID=UPI0006C3BE72|nr:DUF4435 domain-containing protein [Pseudoalteromonas sp. SW0106-04]GAP76966.1 hypothetical protein W04_3545 [Pseudoalteromonas sp. SW0106-04]